VEQHIQVLRQKLDQVVSLEEMVARLLDREHAEAKRLADYEIQDEAFRTGIALGKQMYEALSKRLQDVNLVKGVGGYDVETIVPPAAGRQVAPQALLVFPLAALLGALGGLGLAYLAEAKDQGFRSPAEIRRRLGLPVLGYIPSYRPVPLLPAGSGAPPLDPMLSIFYRSQSPEAEAYRGLRNALCFSEPGANYKVIQIASPNRSEGKSTLAANLAVSLALAGKRVLLVDADLRSPSAHRLFGLTARTGLAPVLAGEAELADAIQPSSIPLLDVLPGGPVPSNPAELLTCRRFPELLDYLRDRYDFVLVDTPALLPVADASAVACRADGVLLTLRPTRNGRPAAERALEALAMVGARVLGVVINGASPRFLSGAYGPGSYDAPAEGLALTVNGQTATPARAELR
jgi:capsular exopolysaccharide synthesis family protein